MSHTHHDHSQDIHAKVSFGFWVYIMTDFIMFATLFATYAVLHNNTFGQPGIAAMSSLHHVLKVTLLILLSSFTCSLALVAKAKEQKCAVRFWLLISILLGALFLGLEYHQLACLVSAGVTWQKSAFLSAYFTTIGIFGIHLAIALLWALILIIQVSMQGLSDTLKTRLTCLGLFWHFLSLIWIFIFTLVYLTGAI